MGQAIPRQHPAVALRSHYRQFRSLLAIALVVAVGLSVALVILASEDESPTTVNLAKPGQSIEYGDFSPQTGKPANVASQDLSGPNVATPDESKVAAAISRTQLATGSPEVALPDESKHAVAVSGAQQAEDEGGPDESSVAAAIAR